MSQLTPMDIHDKEFKRRGRNGYDRYEVDSFLDQIVDDYGDALDRVVDLKNRAVAQDEQIDKLISENRNLQSRVDQFETKEKEIDQLVSSAQESAESIKNDAREEANRIIDEAEDQAKTDTQYERQQKETIKVDYQRLKSEISEFRQKIQKMLESEINNLNDDQWQEALDDYFDTPRFYPEDGSEPIGDIEDVDEDDLDEEEVDNNDEDALESTQDSDHSDEDDKPEPMTGDSPSHETMAAPQPTRSNNGPTIVFPDNYKDHN